MLDPKKKKIYIIIICVNLVGILIIFVTQWGNIFPSTASPVASPVLPSSQTPPTNNNASAAASDAVKKEYTLPKVFPESTNFDASVFESSTYKTLSPFNSLSIQNSEMGRENPFNTY
jgi:hypothetical protein